MKICERPEEKYHMQRKENWLERISDNQECQDGLQGSGGGKGIEIEYKEMDMDVFLGEGE